jgi:pimeloyl-ACP methyl ester carboxylesterase/DNA-binding winged helix-turn-helix (wHTH) protein/class 3 adenylate cyclase
MPLEGRFSFDRFQLDLSTGRLSGKSGPIPLAPKALAVLEYLAARPGRLVSKDELLAAIWPGVFLGGGALRVCVREIRRALGDDARKPRIIETAHRRGYRFIAEVVGSASEPALPAATPLASPLPLPVRYARNGPVNIAYQMLGSGPIDLVFVMGWVSHLEYSWNEPSFARFLRRLARFSRLILLDERGTGLSDRVADPPSLEERVEDVRAVLNAAGSRRAALLGMGEGGPMSSLYAATHPDQTEALIMVDTYARHLRAADYPWGPTEEEREAFCREILERWGGPVGIETRAPGVAADPAFRDWWAAYLRMGSGPAAAAALTRANAQVDVRHVLPTVRVPTLVLHRTGDRCVLVEEGRYVASLIPGARFVELPGEDHLPFVGDQDGLLDEIERFLTVARARAESNRVLATILCAALSGSRGLKPTASEIAGLQALVAAQTRRFRGRDLPREGERAYSAFDGPARAIRCGRSIVDEASHRGIALGIGLHTGEWDTLRTVGEGPVAAAAAQIAALARPGDVLVSRTVVDLVGASAFQFSDRGRHGLVAGELALPLFAVR